MIEIFHDKEDDDAHIKFHRWRHRRDGWYLNPKSSRVLKLHSAKCSHLSNQYRDHGMTKHNGASMTKTKKICSTSRQELEGLALNEGAKLEHCPDC